MSAPFTPEALKFLRSLARHNDRDWFEARRSVYEDQLKAPMLALIADLNADMVAFAPDHVRTPQKTMMRIYRDTRFSSDKRPYKKHIAAWFGRRNAVRTTGAGFYVHISPAEVHVGMGVFMPLPEHLLGIRRWLAENHLEYRKRLKQATGKRKSGLVLETADPQRLARVPKGFAADHPAADLLRARRWGVGCAWPSDVALQPDFSARLLAAFRAAAPVVLALDEAISSAPAAAAKKHKRVLF